MYIWSFGRRDDGRSLPVWGETVVGETVSPSDSIKLVVVSDNDALYYKVVKGVTSIVENRLWELPLR